jgi:CRISPR-associated protein Cmr1
MVKKKQREKEVLEKTVNIIKENLNPGKIIMFGSRAKGKSNYYSDFDLALDLKRPDIRSRRLLKEKIDDAVGLYGIDIVFLNSVDKKFRDLVLETGKVIYEK